MNQCLLQKMDVNFLPNYDTLETLFCFFFGEKSDLGNKNFISD